MNTETTALTNFKTTKEKADRVLALEKITPKDIEDFNSLECEYLAETATEMLRQLKGTERDNFLNKIASIVPASTKNNVWEYNHLVISNSISNYMRQYGIMPPINSIAEETGLSRQTVAKHFAAYKSQPEFTEQMEQFKFMAPKILAVVFKYASSGDMRAARLYLEMVGAINKKQDTVVNEQNNYIQVNNTILSQENLKQLSAEQLNQIESIITNNGLRKNARLGGISDTIRI